MDIMLSISHIDTKTTANVKDAQRLFIFENAPDYSAYIPLTSPLGNRPYISISKLCRQDARR